MAERACAVWEQIRAGAAARNADPARAFERLLPALLSAWRVRADWAKLELNLRLPPDLPPAAARAWVRARQRGR